MMKIGELKLQTPDGKILTRATADTTDVGPSEAGLVIIENRYYTVKESKKLIEKIEAAIESTTNPDNLPWSET